MDLLMAVVHFLFRLGALYRGAECVDPDVGQFAVGEDAQPELDRGVQGPRHHPPHHVLRQ